MENRITFTSADDVPAEMSGHVDRFQNTETFDVACRDVWRASVIVPGAGFYAISRDDADRIMDAAGEEEEKAEAKAATA